MSDKQPEFSSASYFREMASAHPTVARALADRDRLRQQLHDRLDWLYVHNPELAATQRTLHAVEDAHQAAYALTTMLDHELDHLYKEQFERHQSVTRADAVYLQLHREHVAAACTVRDAVDAVLDAPATSTRSS